MKVLTYTTLYPNNIEPIHGVFIKERMTRVAKLCELKVVAPVPYFPPWKRFKRWYRYSQVCYREIRDGIEIYHPRYLITPKVGMSLYGWSMYRCTYGIVQRIQRRYPFDIIDAHYIYPDGLAAVLIGQKLSKPVVLSARGTDINLYPKFPLIRRQIQCALRRSAHIIAVCRALKERIIELGISESKISVIPNGVDIRKFYPMPQHQARAVLGLPQKRFIILSIGNLVECKGFHYLIPAVRILLNSNKWQTFKPLLIIVGKGPLKATLEAQVHKLGLRDHVMFVGAQPHEKLVFWYNAADLFCLASLREGWANVLLEALACGKPVVATNVGGTPEVINSPEYGILVDKGSPEALAQGILKAQATNWNTEHIVEYARQNTWENVAEEVYRVFRKVIDDEHTLPSSDTS